MYVYSTQSNGPQHIHESSGSRGGFWHRCHQSDCTYINDIYLCLLIDFLTSMEELVSLTPVMYAVYAAFDWHMLTFQDEEHCYLTLAACNDTWSDPFTYRSTQVSSAAVWPNSSCRGSCPLGVSGWWNSCTCDHLGEEWDVCPWEHKVTCLFTSFTL